MIEIGMARYAEQSQVRALYAEVEYGGGVNAQDKVLVARSNGEVVGAVHLCLEEKVTQLRGMQISKTYHRQGIGAQRLAACTSDLDQRLSFCLPYSHLKVFYGLASFEIIPQVELPNFLAERLSSYLARRHDIISMKRLMQVLQSKIHRPPSQEPPLISNFSHLWTLFCQTSPLEVRRN